MVDEHVIYFIITFITTLFYVPNLLLLLFCFIYQYIIEYSNLELFFILISFGLAIIALVLTCVLLVAVRAGTNTSSIYSHFALCLLLTQCVYLAATQTRGTLYTYEVILTILFLIINYS